MKPYTNTAVVAIVYHSLMMIYNSWHVGEVLPDILALIFIVIAVPMFLISLVELITMQLKKEDVFTIEMKRHLVLNPMNIPLVIAGYKHAYRVTDGMKAYTMYSKTEYTGKVQVPAIIGLGVLVNE